MIHAYLFITQRLNDREGHGPEFQAHMYRINTLASTKITIYHSFHAEVANYKQKKLKKEIKEISSFPGKGNFFLLIKKNLFKVIYWAHQNKKKKNY